MAPVAPVSDFTVPLAEAVSRTGYSDRHLRRLAATGRLRSAKHRNRLLFIEEDLAALMEPQRSEHDQDRLVAELVAQAPRLSEARRARIAAALLSASASSEDDA